MAVAEHSETNPATCQGDVRISKAAAELGVSAQWLRLLEYEGRVPPMRYDRQGRLFSAQEIEKLRQMGVGSSPPRLRRLEETS